MTTEATTAMAVNLEVRALLAQAALAQVSASEAVQAAQEKAKGAYALFVEGAIAAKTAEVLSAAADDLFSEIRSTGKVRDSRGRPHGIHAKPNKDGTGFLVPSAISAAKSYMLDAMQRGIALVEEGKPRAYSAIRNDVQVAKQAEREATATGDELLRIRGHKLLSLFSGWITDRKGEALARTVHAIEAAIKASQPVLEVSKGEQVAEAAEAAPVTEKATPKRQRKAA